MLVNICKAGTMRPSVPSIGDKVTNTVTAVCCCPYLPWKKRSNFLSEMCDNKHDFFFPVYVIDQVPHSYTDVFINSTNRF